MIEQGDGEDRQDLIERVTKRLADYLGITASDWSYRELAEEVIAEIEWQHVIVPEAEWRDVGELAMTLARWSDVAHDYGWWERNERNSGGRAMTGRDESLIMCDHCKLGFPGGEITNIGTPDEPEWLCVGCYREWREWVESTQLGDGFVTAVERMMPRLKNAPTEVLMPGFDPDDYPLNQPSGSDAQVRSWQGIERTDHPTMPLIGGDDRVAVMDDQDGLLLAVHVIVANVMALLALAYGARAAWRWAR